MIAWSNIINLLFLLFSRHFIHALLRVACCMLPLLSFQLGALVKVSLLLTVFLSMAFISQKTCRCQGHVVGGGWINFSTFSSFFETLILPLCSFFFFFNQSSALRCPALMPDLLSRLVACASCCSFHFAKAVQADLPQCLYKQSFNL